MITIAGIGPRKITPEGIALIQHVGKQLADMGFHLNSGHGEGADQAWESVFPISQKTVYIPWWGYAGVIPDDDPAPFKLVSRDLDYTAMAKKHHPAWHMLTDGAKRLMVRNVDILVSGAALKPVDAVLYWQEPNIKINHKGGTQHALRMAQDMKIPAFNINTEEGQIALDQWISSL